MAQGTGLLSSLLCYRLGSLCYGSAVAFLTH